MRIAIIGSGLSGLTAGAYLAQAGHQVNIYEQYHHPGGVTAPYEADNYKWDLGQLIVEGLGADEPLGQVLSKLGVQDKIQIQKEDRGYVFPDFRLQKPEKYQGVRWRIEQLKSRFPGDAGGLERYWRDYIRFTRLQTYARRSERKQGVSGLYDIEAGVDEARRGIYHRGKRGFVIHIPSLHSPQMAPPGHHAMTIYTICPDRLIDGSWEEKKQEFADDLIGYAQEFVPELSRHVRIRHILTPEDFRKRTHLEHHAFGGIAPVMGTPHIPHRTPIEGLWFVGAQSETGGGVNNVIPGAYKVTKNINSRRQSH
jgi:phytoene dehydrogenase-like protein